MGSKSATCFTPLETICPCRWGGRESDFRLPQSLWNTPLISQSSPNLPRKFPAESPVLPQNLSHVELKCNPEVPLKFPRLLRKTQGFRILASPKKDRKRGKIASFSIRKVHFASFPASFVEKSCSGGTKSKSQRFRVIKFAAFPWC